MYLLFTVLVDLPADGVVLAVVGTLLEELVGLWLSDVSRPGRFIDERVVAFGVLEGGALMAFQRVA